MTRVVPLQDGLEAAVAVLRAGGVVIHPTETVYGIGCALSAGDAGIARVRRCKGIVDDRPYLLVAADREQAFGLWAGAPAGAEPLAARFWPGPLSLVAAARPGLPAGVVGGSDPATIGVRVPDHPGLLRLLALLGEPLVSTSANRAGEPPSTTLPADLLGAALALDGGACPGGQPSTILSLLADPPALLRPGPIPWPQGG